MLQSEHHEQYSKWDMEVAKRIACAVTSYQAGVPYESLWKDFAEQDDEMGTFWLAIARHIREDMPNKPK